MSITTDSRTATGVGLSSVILINQTPKLQAIIMYIVTGTVTFNVEYSLNGTDYIVLSDNSGLSTSGDTTLVFPVHSVRTRITAGTGTVKLIVRQNDGGMGE